MADEETEGTTLDHGPNPALSAQPASAPGWSQPEYSPGADPHYDGTAPPPGKARKAEAKERKATAEEADDAAPAEHKSAAGRAGHRP